jgi:hypothetical protein
MGDWLKVVNPAKINIDSFFRLEENALYGMLVPEKF